MRPAQVIIIDVLITIMSQSLQQQKESAASVGNAQTADHNNIHLHIESANAPKETECSLRTSFESNREADQSTDANCMLTKTHVTSLIFADTPIFTWLLWP